jgi:hypothetical protein
MRNPHNAWLRVLACFEDTAAAVAVLAMLGVGHAFGSSPAAAQTSGLPTAPTTYECAEGHRCTVSCVVHGEKVLGTGIPKTVTVQPLAANNYYVELLEQNGEVHYAYLSGDNVTCILNDVSKKGG